ncbi:MAG TPA: DUF3098 domain-containing protein [Microscillaceae bacterium]|jgi:hypothetical protein|nr:DUF3098 domain-containing protein [Microscillaceae bacterium]
MSKQKITPPKNTKTTVATPPPLTEVPTAQKPLAFTKENYYLMFSGIIALLAGLYIMSIDKETFGFGFMGLTLGPVIVFLSFMVQFVAILYRKK